MLTLVVNSKKEGLPFKRQKRRNYYASKKDATVKKLVRKIFEDATLGETAEKLHEHNRDMTWQGAEMESTALMKSLESITSNGQCSYSQVNETNEQSVVEMINSKLKNLTRFTYGSYMVQMMFDFDVCKGMIQGNID